jgi:hypothetical protein
MNGLQEILLYDFIHLQTHFFLKYNMKKIQCICNPLNLFIHALLIEGQIQVQNIIVEKDTEAASLIQSLYPSYTFLLNINSAEFDRDKPCIFIDTGDSGQDTIIVKTLLEKNPASYIFVRFSSIQSIEGYSCIPISQDLAIIAAFPANFPSRLSFLPVSIFSYSFNSSCISISEESFEPSMLHSEGSQLVYSVRTSITKFRESALGFCDSEGQIIPEFYQIDKEKRTVREDFRFFVWKGELYGSYTYIDPYITSVKTSQTLTVGKFTCSPMGLQIIEEVVPPYAGNLCNQPEKNWTWWESPGGDLHCVYFFSPLKILSFTSLDSTPVEITHPDDLELLKGHIRGGACGVVWDGKVWCFTHTNTESGIFNIGIVVLSHEETPRILGWNHELVRSCDFGRVIFYICGALYCPDKASWHLTGGVQDTKCFILDLPHEYVCSTIHWV